ncbi:hypothetical protein AB0B04_33050 [Streptomyces xinghaiensis]|uniref:hypothetical protein n=1 Tax=Kocuria rhizophila TaxID=72000 RepID=UPI00073D87AD|nr:hypothetical protein [Kocuria rhizophila]
MARLPKEIAKAAKIAKAAGWRVDIRQGKALFFPADKTKGPVTVHFTESDWRAHRNFIAHLRRAGLNI